MWKFFTIFLVVQGILFVLQLWRPVREAVILPFTVGLATLSAWLVKMFDPGVVSSGVVLRHVPNNFAVSIEAGCNGVEAMIILAAAIVAFPSPWKHKLYGLGLGFVAIQSLNLFRIISLFYIGQWNYAVFQWTHLYLWQALIMLDALIFWLVWIRFLPQEVKDDVLVEPVVVPAPVDDERVMERQRRKIARVEKKAKRLARSKSR